MTQVNFRRHDTEKTILSSSIKPFPIIADELKPHLQLKNPRAKGNMPKKFFKQ